MLGAPALTQARLGGKPHASELRLRLPDTLHVKHGTRIDDTEFAYNAPHNEYMKE